MPHTADIPSNGAADPAADALYQGVLDVLEAARVPYLVGGAYALARHTGIDRHTKDLDLFILPADYERASVALRAAGHETELTHPHWLGKVRAGPVFVDLIFNSGNGVTAVDEAWFAHAPSAEVLGRTVRIVPAEELLWSKMFIMERERYDGADVIHLLHQCAARLDWRRLVARVGAHWRVLLSHLVMFGFVYPGERQRLPAGLVQALLQRMLQELQLPAPAARVCQGTLVSREQYLHDIQALGYVDARLTPASSMNAGDVAAWTDAIPERHPEVDPPPLQSATACAAPADSGRL